MSEGKTENPQPIIKSGLNPEESIGAFVLNAADKLAAKLSESTIDQLTGLENRRGLERAKANFEVDRYPVLFIAADLDHLKLINDKYGHEAGDKYILSFVRLIKETFRPDDGVYRLGGDEFLIAVKNTKNDPALSPENLSSRITNSLKVFNEKNLSDEDPNKRIDHPLAFTFAIESSHLVSSSQRLEEVNRAIKTADDKEVGLKQEKKDKQKAQQNLVDQASTNE
ncbi:MAG: GGDEF domain-containing protein [Candidatus Shapirobacteria bacterium]|nr:GGDEF domain-containing protein [Candidatus Shapirobacteria bacterium]